MKNKTKSALILIAFVFAILFSSFHSSSEWRLYKKIQGVMFYYQEVECNDITNGLYQTKIIFKVVNTNAIDLKIDYKIQTWYNDSCSNCDNLTDEYLTSFTLNAGDEIVGDCKSNNLQLFSSFTNYPDVPKLTKFELVEITINPIMNHE